MNFINSQEFAQQLDQQDPLKRFRDQFFIPQHNGRDKIYFTGNSLGLQPRNAMEYVHQELEDWKTLGGEGHFEARRPWFPYHEIFPQQLSKLAGCLPEEVVVMNSLTVNLHLLLISFYRPTRERYKIICEHKAFPSDQYAFESQVRLHGLDPAGAIIEVKPRAGEQAIRNEDVLAAIREHGSSTAVVLFSGINYYTGQVFDMESIAKAGHEVGAYVGFDLAHAIGNITLRMRDWNIDFACWCTYKYLNSGPGSVGGIYIQHKHAVDTSLPRLAGWWGYKKETRFNMEKGFVPIPTAEGWQLSNAPVLSMAPHKAALDIFDEAGMEAIAGKGQQLGSFLIFILKEIDQSFGGQTIRVITPEQAKGCQVSFVIPQYGKLVYEHIMNNGVSAGWREPEVIRVAPVALYNTFEEVWRFGKMIEEAIRNVKREL